jgi:hypothetical protein
MPFSYRNHLIRIMVLAAAIVTLAGCETNKYAALPASNQTLVPVGADKPPRIASKQKNVVIAEPRNPMCDGEKEFSFNVVFGNRQTYSISLAPSNFEIAFRNHAFPAMAEADVEKEIHSDDWFKNSMLVLGAAGAIAGVAGGDLAGAQGLLLKTATDYQLVDSDQNAEMEKYRNKVLKTGTVDPHSVYGGLIVARADTDGKSYSFNSANKMDSIDLIVKVDGEEQTLSFNCAGTP